MGLAYFKVMLKKKIIIITGWGMGVLPLKALGHELQQKNYCIFLHDIFDPCQIPASLIDEALHADLLVGWSLGGQLAVALSKYLLHYHQYIQPVITLASNPRFVASPNWPHAMTVQAFDQFQQQYLRDSKATLKQFYFNICRGDRQAKAQWKMLLAGLPKVNEIFYAQGLQWLQQLDVLEVLEAIPSHHIFAAHDQLVPTGAVYALQQQYSCEVMPDVSHSFPAFHPKATAERIENFLQT